VCIIGVSRGGFFFYPFVNDPENPGKLRLFYEPHPWRFIMERVVAKGRGEVYGSYATEFIESSDVELKEKLKPVYYYKC